MRLLISGYRNYNNYQNIKKEMLNILKAEENHVVIHGACKGVDSIASKIAEELNLDEEQYPANWNLGLRAGPLRNERMITEGKPDMALIFISKFSKGTLNMKNLLIKYNIKYKEIIVD
jgi:hypothetical protein